MKTLIHLGFHDLFSQYARTIIETMAVMSWMFDAHAPEFKVKTGRGGRRKRRARRAR